jgi:GAF domain-containing protein
MNYRLKKGEGLAGWVVDHQQSLIVPDADLDKRHSDVSRHTGVNLRTIASVPLLAGKKVIGVLQAADLKVSVLNQTHLELLEPLAGFAATAAMNARRLAFVQAVGANLAITTEQSESEAYDWVRDVAGGITNPAMLETGNMYIALYDQTQNLVSFGFAYVDGKPVDIANDPKWRPRPAGKGMTEVVIQRKAPILIHTRAEAEKLYKEWGLTNYIRKLFASWVGVPMMVGDQVIGVFAVYHSEEENRFDESDVKTLELFGVQAAAVINNARLSQEWNRKIEELNELNDLGMRLSNITGRITESLAQIDPSGEVRS